MHEETVEADKAIAKERGFLFGVMRKEKRHGTWTEVVADIDDLQKAMTLAGAVEAFEVGVFLGGKIYWTSRSPDVLNSTVIRLPLSSSSPPLKIAPGEMQRVAWSLIFRVSNRLKAMKELQRAEALLGQNLQVVSFEPYWKIDGEWRCEGAAKLEAASLNQLVTKSLLQANRLASEWSVRGPHLDEAGKLESFEGTFQEGHGGKARLQSLVWAHFFLSQQPLQPSSAQSPDQA